MSLQILSGVGIAAAASISSNGRINPTLDPTNPNSQVATTNQTTSTGSGNQGTLISGDKDTRIRLRAMRGQESQVYGDSGILTILNPLTGGTNGLIFPYTPTIQVTHQTDYSSTQLVHANEDIDHYVRTPSVKISLTAKFTIQNQREGRYALAALHFFRTMSKMYFGQADVDTGRAGLPPPVLVFSGYGDYMFDNLPVIVLSHSYSFDDHMDTVIVNAAEYDQAFLLDAQQGLLQGATTATTHRYLPPVSLTPNL